MSAPNPEEPCCDAIDWTKLGRCRKCMTLAGGLTVAFWAMAALVAQRAALRPLSPVVLALASLFTLLSLAHAVAYVRRRRAQPA